MDKKRLQIFKILIIVFGIVCVLLFAYFVWPSQYKHSEVSLGFVDLKVRENRFTGQSQMCGGGKWQTVIFDGTSVSFPQDFTLTIGGRNTCPGIPWFGFVELAGAFVIELALVLFYLFETKRQKLLPVESAGIQKVG
jgi:hypothetical protein